MKKNDLHFLYKMLKILRLTLIKLNSSNTSPFTYDYAQYSGQDASDLIYSRLNDESPLMISRFGSSELNCVLNYLGTKHNSSTFIHYILNHYPSLFWEKMIINNMSINAGFFTANESTLCRFSEMIIEDMQLIDILGSWQSIEKYFDRYLKNAIRIRLPDIEPYYHQHPWSKALEGKKVLVIHPFKDSIEMQFKRKDCLFKNKEILPSFELITYRSVQTIAGNSDRRFKNWFEALSYMKEDISKIEFDIAIIGCGAYGMPLAAHVKRIGRKAIHVGGATQVIFGVKGNRWENDPDVACYMNDNWIKPLPHETPKGNQLIEGACYW
jgi:hypothetical protein